MAGPSGAAPDAATELPTEASFRSLAMELVVAHFDRRRDCCVLDLGRGSGSNIEFLTRFSTRIFVEDIYHTLASFGEPFCGEARAFCPVYESLLPYRGELQFDVILLWNLFDYLDREEIRRLTRHLAGMCGRGTLIYALISIHQQIPETPTNFKIVGDNQLVYQYTSHARRAGPRHSQVKLLESMPGFRVKRSFLLKSGMQEYLFEPA